MLCSLICFVCFVMMNEKALSCLRGRREGMSGSEGREWMRFGDNDFDRWRLWITGTF